MMNLLMMRRVVMAAPSSILARAASSASLLATTTTMMSTTARRPHIALQSHCAALRVVQQQRRFFATAAPAAPQKGLVSRIVRRLASTKFFSAFVKYGPSFAVLYTFVNFSTIMTIWAILCLPSMESVNVVHLLDSVGLREPIDHYLIDISHIRPVWSNLFMAYVVNHLFGPIQVPFTLLITPYLHHRIDPYLPKFLTSFQQYVVKRIADFVGPDADAAATANKPNNTKIEK